MIHVEDYKQWFLPQLRKSQVWDDYISAIAEEVVILNMNNMGTCDSDGLNGVVEDVSINSGWELCTAYDLSRGVYTGVSGLSVIGGSFIFDGVLESYAVMLYPFILNREYSVHIEKVGAGGLFISLGGDFVEYSEGMVLEAKDYSVVLRFSGDVLEVSSIELRSVHRGFDAEGRKTVLSRILNIDKANEYVLKTWVESIGMPFVQGMNKEILRGMVRYYGDFVSTIGSELAGAIFMYMLGYAARVRYLYARRDDYEGGFLPQTQSGTEAGVATVEVASTGTVIQTGVHNILKGDVIYNVTNPFHSGGVVVTKTEPDKIWVESVVSVSEGDVLDAERIYDYSVNPDPELYFKTTHIDCIFEAKYDTESVLIFTDLQELLEQYLPVNVCIRFLGVAEPSFEESFVIKQDVFQANIGSTDTLYLTEEVIMPDMDIIFIAGSNENPDAVDIDDVPIERYSYTGYYEDGVWVYLYFPKE
jgi:hypothetical protein